MLVFKQWLSHWIVEPIVLAYKNKKVTHTWNLCSAFNPSKMHTHSSEHTNTVNTHPEQWAAIYAAAPGEQLGVRFWSSPSLY